MLWQNVIIFGGPIVILKQANQQPDKEEVDGSRGQDDQG